MSHLWHEFSSIEHLVIKKLLLGKNVRKPDFTFAILFNLYTTVQIFTYLHNIKFLGQLN